MFHHEYSYYKNWTIITAQILSVIAFVIALIGYYISGDIAAAIAMVLLLSGTCCDVKPVSSGGEVLESHFLTLQFKTDPCAFTVVLLL
jgi:putative effector of murein hydrolase LrgA (UPF0299 family)